MRTEARNAPVAGPSSDPVDGSPTRHRDRIEAPGRSAGTRAPRGGGRSAGGASGPSLGEPDRALAPDLDPIIAGAPMTSRITFSSAFPRAIRIRGLTLTELARRANTSVATASKAAHQRQVNMTPGLRLARAVSASPIVPELEEWT